MFGIVFIEKMLYEFLLRNELLMFMFDNLHINH